MRFNGPSYDPKLDKDRLEKQLGRIYQCMSDENWRTLTEIKQVTGDPESSISAQLRHLRKEEFGCYIVNKRRRGESGSWEYQLRPPLNQQQAFDFDQSGQGSLFPMKGATA